MDGASAPGSLGGDLLNLTNNHRREGVTSFLAEHQQQPLPRRYRHQVDNLIGWRRVMFDLGLIGQRADRYDGAGYGNISVRLTPFQRPRGERAFLITGTQTGGKSAVGEIDISCVRRYSAGQNKVYSAGLTKPSSESMSHGALYDLSLTIGAVVHVHSELIWSQRSRLGLPTTHASVDYGTPQMASAISELWRKTSLADGGILATAGHIDGIFAFGRRLDEACHRLLTIYARCHHPLN